MLQRARAAALARQEVERQHRLQAKEQRQSLTSISTKQTVEEYYAGIRTTNPVTAAWIKFGERARIITLNRYFTVFMNTVICLAGALVGLQTYGSFESDPNIEKLDLFVLVVFCVECVLKIVADPLRPWKYFTLTWNNFDFLIVISCLVIPGGSGAVLRLLRLLRVLKLLRSNAHMRMIFVGLLAGMQSAVFVFVLIGLIYYMYAAVGIMMFSKQDPVHFGDFSIAFVTLYRIATLDSWSEITYINYFGCEVYPSIGYVTLKALEAENRTLGITETLCSPDPIPYVAYIYFHSFVVLATLILLSLFVGIMAIAMIGVIHQMAEEQEQQATLQAADRKAKLFDKLYRGSAPEDSSRLILKERQKVFKICKALAISVGGDFDNKFREKEAGMMKRKFAATYVHFALYCRTITSSIWFNNFIAVTIVSAGIIVGLQADGIMPAVPIVENIITGIFISEATMKIIGEMTTPWRYFEDPWNRFDFFVIVINFAVVRLARLLRVLKLLKIIPKLQLIVNTILNSFSSIIYIGGILALVYFLFGVAGCVLFVHSLYASSLIIRIITGASSLV
jgi:voltage-gated sodium channel